MDDDKLDKSTSTDDAVVAYKDKLGNSTKANDTKAESRPSSQDPPNQLEFSGDEETLIVRMYNLVGERWSLIAGRIPGRSAEEIEQYWNSRQPTIVNNKLNIES